MKNIEFEYRDILRPPALSSISIWSGFHCTNENKWLLFEKSNKSRRFYFDTLKNKILLIV